MNNKTYLYHHGILGQKWGRRNGPPYPLADNKHSTSEKKAGWRASLKRPSIKLSSKQKRLMLIGMSTAIGIGAGIYLHNSAKSKLQIANGRLLVNKFFNSKNSFGKSISEIDKTMVSSINSANKGLKGNFNCTHCSLSYILNSIFGMNTTASSFNGVDEVSGMFSKGRDAKIFDRIFDDLNWVDSSNNEGWSTFVDKIPKGSTGIIGVEYPDPKTKKIINHMFNYERNINGELVFIDCQIGDVAVADSNFLKALSDNGYLPNGCIDFSNAKLKSNTYDILKKMVIGL